MAATKDSGTITIHDVALELRPVEATTEAELEQLLFATEQALYEHADGEALSAAVAGRFRPPTIEVDLSIPATSGSVLNQRIAGTLAALDRHLEGALQLVRQRVERAAD